MRGVRLYPHPANSLTYLHQNTPNPFSNTTTIMFDIDTASPVLLTVHNSIGQEVLRIPQESYSQGTHSIQLNAETLPSGMYTYRLQTASSVFVKKMVIIR